MKKLLAGFIGTMWLIFGGCGSAVLATGGPGVDLFGIGYMGVALAFGLTVVTMAYAIGHISGCHLNPAVSIGLWVGGRFDSTELLPYIGAHVLGGIAGVGILYLIVQGQANFDTVGNFASNGYGTDGSPGGYSMLACLTIEIITTFMFLMIILGATHSKAPKYLAGLAIGLGLTLVHLISIPVTNTSVNPARSTSQAIFADNDWAMGNLWLFWVAPIVGAILAGIIYKNMSPEEK